MLVFGIQETFLELLQRYKIVQEKMLVSVLDRQPQQMVKLAHGRDNFVLLAKHLEVKFKSRLSLMVFQTIVTLAQRLLQLHLVLIILLIGNLILQQTLRLLQQHKMR